jgi:membrane protein
VTLKDLFRDIYELLKDTYNHWSDAKAPQMGASLAYYTVFSVSPLLLISIAVANWVLGPEVAQDCFNNELTATVGKPVADAIQSILIHAQGFRSGVLATIAAVITLLCGASGVFGQLQESLNTIWGVEPKPGRGLKGIVRDRFLSFTMVLGTAFLLLVSLVISTALAALGHLIHPEAGFFAAVWQVVHGLISFGIITLLFALIYKVLPDATIGWRDVWVGAALTAVLFTVGKFLLGFYLARGSVTSGYGAAGSLVLILVWVYYSSQILLFGAAFTRVYADRYGSHVRPTPNAVAVTPEAQARQGRPRAQPIDQHQHA